MTPKEDMLDESEQIINEIESNLEKVLQQRKEEVERDMQLKVKLEKEDADRKKSLIEGEFEKERGTIKEFRSAISEFETARKNLQDQMRDHLERGMRYQQDIEKLTSLTLEELRKVGELSGQLSELRQTSEKKIAEVRTKLKERFGIGLDAPAPVHLPVPPQPPAPPPSFEGREESAMASDLDQELTKLKKIKELLETDSAGPERPAFEKAPAREAFAEPQAVPEEPEFVLPERFEPLSFERDQPRPEFKMPEINQFIDDFMKRGSPSQPEPIFREPAPVKKAERKQGLDELSFQAVFETLEKYRKTEPLDFNGEISYFQNRERLILDGESLIRAMGQVLESAKKQTHKLSQTESPKDQFFLKQELINHQESLRKILLRWVRMCEKDGGSLPRYTNEIINLAVLKDILEKLNMDNWSNPEDVGSFESLTLRLKDAFYRKITPPAYYLRSIIEELEG